MSRIGRTPIPVPDKVKVDITGGELVVSGPKGTLTYTLPHGISLKQDNNTLIVEREDESKLTKSEARTVRSMHGLARSLINNMVIGVSEGFKKELHIMGVGYRAQVKGKNIVSLFLGHSHSIEYFLPEGITASVESTKGLTKLILEGYDKQLVGEVAAQIRKFRPPEPYKGKGIRYSDEVVKKKAGKSVVGK